MDLERVPAEGSSAPDFELPDDIGRIVRLSDEVAKGTVLLLFYPADFGMICSIQMGELRDLYEEFVGANVLILPISTNSVRSHSAWKEAMRLPFPLLSDEDGRITGLYSLACDDDAWLKNRACRAAFVIDDRMVVRYRWVPPNPHVGPDVPMLLEKARAVSVSR